MRNATALAIKEMLEHGGAVVKLRRVAGSIVVSVPREIMEKACMEEKEKVYMEATPGQIVIISRKKL